MSQFSSHSESRQCFLRVYVVLQRFYWHLKSQSWLDRDWETGKRESNWILNGICHNVRVEAVIGSDKVQLLSLSTTLVRPATITSSYRDVYRLQWHAMLKLQRSSINCRTQQKWWHLLKQSQRGIIRWGKAALLKIYISVPHRQPAGENNLKLFF